VTLLVDEQGAVQCNGGRTRHLSDPALVQARAITEELAAPAAGDTRLISFGLT